MQREGEGHDLQGHFCAFTPSYCFYLISIFVSVLRNERGPAGWITCFVLLVRPLKERCRPWKPWLRPSSTSSLEWPQSCLWTCPSSSPSCLSLTSWASQLPWWSTTACELPTHWAAVFSCLQPAGLGKPRSNKPRLHSRSSPRLTAIRDHSLEMKLLQKKAFVKRLLQSNSVGDVSHWPPYFLTSILPLLPCLPVSHFQQLTSKQVRPHVKYSNTNKMSGDRESF